MLSLISLHFSRLLVLFTLSYFSLIRNVLYLEALIVDFFLFIFVQKNYSTFCIFTLPYYLLSKIVALQNQTQVQLRFRNMVKIHTLAFPKYPEPEQGGKD